MDFQSVPPSRSGGGGGEVGKKEGTVVMHGEKKISRVKEESCPSIDKPGFTVLQLQELQQQTLIHRHITAGLPVPFHLVLPIWKSVASSFGASSFAFYNQFPSFRGFSPQGFGYRHMMDTVPEPRRCRRTDGKKWRCSKNVVPGEKYCEQHMHRGRQQRSRKLVEASQIASPSNPTTTREGKPKGKPPQNPSSNILGLQLMTPPSNANHGSTPITSNLSNKRVSYVTSPCFTTNTTSGNGANTSAIVSKNCVPVLATNDGKGASEMHLGNTSIIKGSNISDKNICVGRNVSQGLGFSPKTVLQVVHCNGLYIDNRNGVWLEPRRCRRTDGKKWRCRRDIIPGQKYCARHMHRGAKKVPKPLELTASSGATNTAPLPPATAMAVAMATARSCQTDHASPNTNLSMSILTSQPPISNSKKSDSGNSSDTTITDTSIGACASSKVPT